MGESACCERAGCDQNVLVWLDKIVIVERVVTNGTEEVVVQLASCREMSTPCARASVHVVAMVPVTFVHTRCLAQPRSRNRAGHCTTTAVGFLRVANLRRCVSFLDASPQKAERVGFMRMTTWYAVVEWIFSRSRYSLILLVSRMGPLRERVVDRGVSQEEVFSSAVGVQVSEGNQARY